MCLLASYPDATLTNAMLAKGLISSFEFTNVVAIAHNYKFVVIQIFELLPTMALIHFLNCRVIIFMGNPKVYASRSN